MVTRERAGGIVVAPRQAGIEPALREIHARSVQSIVIEGGSALHQAFWEAKLVDYVQLYVAPTALGDEGIPLASDAFSTFALYDRRVEALGPDVLVEGYVHRPY